MVCEGHVGDRKERTSETAAWFALIEGFKGKGPYAVRVRLSIRSRPTAASVGVVTGALRSSGQGADGVEQVVVEVVEQQRVRPDSVRVVAPQPASFYARRGKRAFDLAASVSLCILLMPAMLLIGLALRVSLDRGILFKQDRVGLNGRSFAILKFRTMEQDRRVTTMAFDGEDRRVGHKSEDDPRHTPTGKLLRKFSLDELPQLLNVIKGDMSLVGPRPELVSVASSEFVDHPRHWVRPGLTGPFQLSELRRTGDLTTGLLLDAKYVGGVTLVGDLVLILRTLRAVLRGQGS